MPSTPRAPLIELADPELEWKRFERFCLDLARSLPDVADAHLYGTRGEAQQGIDIHADLVDGRVRTIQCRRVSRFSKTSAQNTIAETSYDADEHRVWSTSPMSAGARAALRAAPNWDGWDIEQISSVVRGLPRELARWIVEDHLGSGARRRFLGPEGVLCVAPARSYFERRDADDAQLPTNQPLVGRDEELAELRAAMADRGVRLALVAGRPGIGKTRLLRAVSDDVSDGERVLVLREGIDAPTNLLEELPRTAFTLLVDDADRRSDLPAVLATVLPLGDVRTIVLATRPQHVPALRAAIAAGGVASHAVREVTQIGSLSQSAASALAAHALGGTNALSDRLGRWTRDVPALCILGARLVMADRLDPAHLSNNDSAQREILSRFRDELLGKVSERADPTLVRRLLEAVAALQPIELHADPVRGWLADFLSCETDALEDAARALEEAGLLARAGRRRRIVPDILADFVLQTACTRDGSPTDYAPRIMRAATYAARPRVLANLAELDWRLSEAGRRTVLDDIQAELHREIIVANAWDREQMLKQLGDAAPYLGRWIVQLARDVLDRPAADVDIGFGHIVSDANARMGLVPLLRSAGLDLRVTEAAVALLWEIGRDGVHKPILGEVDPLKAAADFGNYELGLPYADAVLAVVEELLNDPAEAERRRDLPLKLLQPMTQREGTRSASRGYAIEFTPFFVSAPATEPLRARLRTLLVRVCLEGSERTRPAAAALLGDMLAQPHGYFGQPVSDAELAQWRNEQLLILADAERVLMTTDDVLVTIRLRDDLDWHARHSAIRGIRTRARAVLRAFPPASPELLIRSLTGNLERFDEYEAGERRYRAAARRIVKETPRPADLLDLVDAALHLLNRADPEAHSDPRRLLSDLAAYDATWGLAAAKILVDEPQRPSATAVGGLLSETLSSEPDGARSILTKLGSASDPMLRRLASDHVARMRWVADPDAPERDLAVALASDDDQLVVIHVVLAAHRLADHEPDLARRIVLAVRSLAEPAVAKYVCMVLSHDIGLGQADEDLVLDGLLECPDVDFWQDRFLLRTAERRPGRVLRYFLARLDREGDDYGYRAVPIDGLSKDPLAEADTYRRDALRELVGTAPKYRHTVREMHLATLFWSFAAGTDEAFEALAETVSDRRPEVREGGEEILAQAERGLLLARPAWIAEQLGRARVETLDALRSALHAALTSGIKQGTPGQPYPEDVLLRDKAREYAAASRPGSRAASFWLAMVRSAEQAIRESVERDERFGADD